MEIKVILLRARCLAAAWSKQKTASGKAVHAILNPMAIFCCSSQLG
jgi:hypothetical protein